MTSDRDDPFMNVRARTAKIDRERETAMARVEQMERDEQAR
jgi:hypothetical protein